MSCSVSILSYMEFVSAVKSRAFGGRLGMVLSSSVTCWLSLSCIFTKGLSFCSWQSNYLLQSFMNILAQQTIGRNLKEFLWIFKVILNLASLLGALAISLTRKVCSALEMGMTSV